MHTHCNSVFRMTKCKLSGSVVRSATAPTICTVFVSLACGQCTCGIHKHIRYISKRLGCPNISSNSRTCNVTQSSERWKMRHVRVNWRTPHIKNRINPHAYTCTYATYLCTRDWIWHIRAQCTINYLAVPRFNDNDTRWRAQVYVSFWLGFVWCVFAPQVQGFFQRLCTPYNKNSIQLCVVLYLWYLAKV